MDIANCVDALKTHKEIISSITYIISGIIGGLVVALLERKTQERNWLLQNRAQVFAELLRTIEKCEDETAKFFRENPESGISTEQKILDIYAPAFLAAKVARLFANKDSRTKIEQLARGIYQSHSSRGRGDERYKELIKKFDELQEILEGNLRNPKW